MRTFWLVIAALAMPASAFADSGDLLSRLNDWVSFQGQCSQLVVNGVNKTAVCDPAATYQQYTNGFVSFTAIIHGDGVVSFSGNKDRQLDPSHYQLQVQHVLYVGWQGLKDYSVTGSCSVSGTLRPVGVIACDAAANRGEPFHFAFYVNGFRHLLEKRQAVRFNLPGNSP